VRVICIATDALGDGPQLLTLRPHAPAASLRETPAGRPVDRTKDTGRRLLDGRRVCSSRPSKTTMAGDSDHRAPRRALQWPLHREERVLGERTELIRSGDGDGGLSIARRAPRLAATGKRTGPTNDSFYRKAMGSGKMFLLFTVQSFFCLFDIGARYDLFHGGDLGQAALTEPLRLRSWPPSLAGFGASLLCSCR
jgi:hypothetical protein